MAEEISFGNMLKWARMRVHWTQQRVADELEVSRVTVNRWENDLQLPSAYYLKQLVAILELNEKEADALYRAAGQVPQEIENLPFQRNPFFTGREEHLERLGKLLQETGTAEITQSISISGLGGIGKTQLALEYAHRSYPNVYRAALWVNAADTATLQASYDDLAQRLELPERNKQKVDWHIQAVKNWLQTHTNWLLIMDNADDLPLARSFLPAKPLGHVVFTTRSQIIGTATTQARHIEIEALEPDKGLLLLLRRSHVLEDEAKLDMVAADIREPALLVVELLGGLPLALDQAGAYIEATDVSFTDYLKRYNKHRRLLLSKRRLLESKSSNHLEYIQHPESVVTTFELSFQKARELHPLVGDILNFCAFLQPDTIPEELFEYDDSFMFDTTTFDEAIAALHRYSLIKRDMHYREYSMHRLVQAVLIDAMSPDLQKRWRERVVRTVNAAFPEVGFKHWLQHERLLSQALVCATWTEDEITPTVEVAELFHKLGMYLRDQKQFADAEPLVSRALSIYKQHFGVEHLVTATALHDLATISFVQGKYSQAESLYQQALTVKERQLGAHPDTLRTLHNMGNIYYVQDNDEQFKLLYQRTRWIWENQLGADPPDTARPLREWVQFIHEHGSHEQKDAWYRSILSFQEQRFGATHPRVQEMKRNYAEFLRSIGHDAEAATLETNDEPSG